MAAPSVTLRSSRTNLFMAAGVTALIFSVILLMGPTSAFPLGLLGLMPSSWWCSSPVALSRTAKDVLEQQTAWRDERVLAAQPATEPRATTSGPTPRWTNES